MCIYLWVCAACVQVPAEAGREDSDSFRTVVVGSYELPHRAVELNPTQEDNKHS